MIHANNPIIKHKAGLLNLAEELGNVSKASKVTGFSRDTFYRYHELIGVPKYAESPLCNLSSALSIPSQTTENHNPLDFHKPAG